MFWELRPQGVSSSFTQQNLPKQSLSYIGVPLGLTLLLVNLFDFLIQRRPNEIWHNTVKLVDFNGLEYVPPIFEPFVIFKACGWNLMSSSNLLGMSLSQDDGDTFDKALRVWDAQFWENRMYWKIHENHHHLTFFPMEPRSVNGECYVSYWQIFTIARWHAGRSWAHPMASACHRFGATTHRICR